MTHTVTAGDTLSTIATKHGVTVAQLLDANPSLKPDPNRIRAGDVLNLPASAGPAAVPVTPEQPTVAAGRILGKLSERFETSGKGPGTVSGGQGDPGGVSYGSYQMTSRDGGTVARFVSQPDFPFRANFAGLTPGTPPFTAAWKDLANAHRDEFQAIQHEFIKRTHFDPLVRKIMQEDGLNVLGRSHALQDVIWSTAVQHGAASGIPHRVMAAVGVSPADADFDRQFIVAIYTERGRKDANGVLVHFSRASAAVQRGVAARFQEEQQKALEMLAQELTV
jgi:LysM repeat protein